MKHPTLEKYKIHREQVIKFFESEFHPVTVKFIKNMSMKMNVSVISLMMLYYLRKKIMLRVIGVVIYTIIGNYICIDFTGLSQYSLSRTENNF